MRTSTISNTTTTYPERIAWLKDSNVIKLTSTDEVGAEVIITEPSGDTHTLVYFSDTNSLMFILDDALKSLYKESLSPWNIQVKVYEEGLLVDTLGFYMYVFDGKSFITRSHGSAKTIYVYNQDELSKLQIYSPSTGIATLDNWSGTVNTGITGLNLQSVIQSAGDYSLCVASSSAVPSSAVIIADESVNPTKSNLTVSIIAGYDPDTKTGGDVWGTKTIFPMCYNIIYPEVCDGYDFIELMYVNTDGCYRYLGGKLLSETDDVKEEGWSTITTEIYNANPSRWIQSSEKVIKVGFSDILKDSYSTDILYSDNIWLRTWDNEWRKVRLKTSSLTITNEEYQDFELELYVHSI